MIHKYLSFLSMYAMLYCIQRYRNTQYEVTMQVRCDIGKTILHKLPVYYEYMCFYLVSTLLGMIFYLLSTLYKNPYIWFLSLNGVLPALQMFHVFRCSYSSQCNVVLRSAFYMGRKKRSSNLSDRSIFVLIVI